MTWKRAALVHGPTRTRVVMAAVRELAALEAAHPVRFDPDQRVAAVEGIVRRELGVDALPGRVLAAIRESLA